jgi:hypothetical protein
MRRAARVDRNHGEIINAFRAYGFSVADTSRLGAGFGDAVISKSMKTALVEIKDGELPPSARQLTQAEIKFRDSWQGIYLLIESLDDVEDVVRNWAKL